MEKPDIVLSENIISGLKNLDLKLNVELSKKLLSNVVKLALFSDHSIPSNPEVSASNPDYVKQCEYAVITLLVLAGKHDYDKQALRNLLQFHGISQLITDEIEKIYELTKSNFLSKSLKTGICFPHLTEVEWSVSSNIPSLPGEKSEITCHIDFGRLNEQTGDRETLVQFDCNVEELQSLIMKFKEIKSHCESVCSS